MSFASLIRPPGGLAHRLSWLYGLLFSFTLALALTVCYVAARSLLQQQEDEDLIEDVIEFNGYFAESGLSGVKKEIRRELLGGEHSDIYFRVYNKSGEPVFSSNLASWPEIPNPAGMLANITEDEDSWLLGHRQYQGKEFPTAIALGPLGRDYFIEIGESTEENQEIMDLLLRIFLALLVVVVPVTAFGGWLVARRSVRDLAQVGHAARLLRDGDLQSRARVSAGSAVEVSELAETFNSMAAKVENLLDEMQEITDNVAHDLRSPITRIRAICETALTSCGDRQEFVTAAEDTLIECDRLIAMINATLEVSEIETGIRQPPREPLSLSKLVVDACELYEPLAESHQLRLCCQVQEGCEMTGQRYSLQRMLGNLIDNAIKYSPGGQQIEVTLERSEQGFQLTVTDRGVGIAPSERTKVFNRFYRCASDRSRDGCGLGLSFARAVARSHGGDIRLSSQVGAGSAFTVVLPRAFSRPPVLPSNPESGSKMAPASC
jgi:signal transduction histidine kinase